MQTLQSLAPPARRLLAILGFNLLLAALAISLALLTPLLGLTLQPGPDGDIIIVKAEAPGLNIHLARATACVALNKHRRRHDDAIQRFTGRTRCGTRLRGNGCLFRAADGACQAAAFAAGYR